MYRFAKKKVDDLIAGIQALDAHVKAEFLALEKILTDIEIDATFDPESAADIAWITTEISKILEDSPQIQELEVKLGMVKDADPVLEKVMKDLRRVTDITRILDEQEKLNAPLPHYNKPMDAATDKEEKKADAKAAPAEEGKKEEAKAAAPDAAAPAAPAAPADLPPELNPAAAGAVKQKTNNATKPAASNPAPAKTTQNTTKPAATPAPAANPAPAAAPVPAPAAKTTTNATNAPTEDRLHVPKPAPKADSTQNQQATNATKKPKKKKKKNGTKKAQSAIKQQTNATTAAVPGSVHHSQVK